MAKDLQGVHFSAPFIRRPVATFLLSAAIILAGIVAYMLLPVASLPQVEYPVISVGAGLPGADPETMASAVATPLERQFSRIAGINQMTSSSSTGQCSITMQFDLSRDVNGAARDVQAAINAARSQLPANLPSNPTYRKINPADSPILILALTSDTMTVPQMYDAADASWRRRSRRCRAWGRRLLAAARSRRCVLRRIRRCWRATGSAWKRCARRSAGERQPADGLPDGTSSSAGCISDDGPAVRRGGVCAADYRDGPGPVSVGGGEHGPAARRLPAVLRPRARRQVGRARALRLAAQEAAARRRARRQRSKAIPTAAVTTATAAKAARASADLPRRMAWCGCRTWPR